MSTLLEIRHLTRDYAPTTLFGRGPAQRALDDVSLSVGAGSILGVVGESGSGKSTLARLIMALDQPTNGEVRFEGENLFALSPNALRRKRRDFQMVFQDPFGSLDPRRTVGASIAEPLHVLPERGSRAAVAARVAAMLESVGLPADAAHRTPHAFSGGQRQRIAIARALITEPKLVVADEAVSALDLSVQAQILNLLLDLRDRRGITIVFISHNLAVVDCIADRVAVLYRGRLVETGPAHAVFDQPLHPYTRLLKAAEPDIHRPGPPPRLETPAVPVSVSGIGCAFLSRCPLAGDRCATEPPALRAAGPERAVACHHAFLDQGPLS